MKIYKIHYWQHENYFHEFTATIKKKQIVLIGKQGKCCANLNVIGKINIYPNDSSCVYFLDRKSLKKYENLLKNLRYHSTIYQNLKKHI